MYADHDHRGEYADQRHDHDGDYAERYHRHKYLENEDERLKGEIRELAGQIAVLRRELDDAFNLIGELKSIAAEPVRVVQGTQVTASRKASQEMAAELAAELAEDPASADV